MNIEDNNKCEKCSPGYYIDIIGSSYCKECEENKYSFYGFNKCLNCDDLIPHCNKCSKDGRICLECNNNALNGYNNCTICENDFDWEYNGEYCKLLKNCEYGFYKDKNNNNKIICINNVMECPKGMDYLNLSSKECVEEEKIKNHDFFLYKFESKNNEILNNSMNIIK